MKLELKHIAPYLYFDVKVTYVQRLFGGEKIVKHHNQSIDRIFMDYGFINLHTEPYSKQAPLNDYLLELRPLSDLTKEIEVNGEKFVPKDKLFYSDKTWIQFKKSITKNAIHCEPYYIIENLLKWHFDVFGLIEQGLAIDINTI